MRGGSLAGMATEAAAAAPQIPAQYPVEVTVRPGRGRCLVTSRELPAGGLVLAEEPLLTWPEGAPTEVCAGCLRMRGGHAKSWRVCDAARGCGDSCWCSDACEAADRANGGGHGPARCAAVSSQAIRRCACDFWVHFDRILVCSQHRIIRTTSKQWPEPSRPTTTTLLSYVTAALELRQRAPERYEILAQQCDVANLDDAEVDFPPLFCDFQ